MGKPVVAIIGRQNVGKSTLLNRMAGQPLSIVADVPGTTRDRVFADVAWNDKSFTAIDTGGLTLTQESHLAVAVELQANVAISEADLIIFLVDVKDGVTFTDQELADKLRGINKPVLLVVNKVDNTILEASTAEFYKLGMGEPLPVSAYHGRGISTLLDKIVELLPPSSPEETSQEDYMKVAIVGRPGVGKSMLLNALIGEERAIVGDKPGTTRDAIDSMVDFGGQNVLLIDTAGIRRRGQVEPGIEEWSVIRAMRAIDRSDVALLVLDTGELVAAQDTHVAGYIVEAAKGLVLLVNKWDLVMPRDTNEYTSLIKDRLKFVPYATILYISAKLGWGLEEVLPEALKIYQERHRRIEGPRLAELVRQAVDTHPPPHAGKRQLKILSVSQTGVNPPFFTFLVNDPKLVHFSYRRFLENRLRESFGFAGTPVRLVFKARG